MSNRENAMIGKSILILGEINTSTLHIVQMQTLIFFKSEIIMLEYNLKIN